MAISEIISYDTNLYDFRSVIQGSLGISELENIHHFVNYDIFTLDNDQSSLYHKKFYKNPPFP